jgi:phosphatidylethanolamine-binding protein (PEBP) family uncharacterized protein
MEVFYNGKLAKNNEILKVSETQVEHEIKLNVNNNNFYTLILYDPDAVGGTHIHWAKINITNNDINTGTIIIPYKGPAPPASSGKHRYIFNLYQQNGVNNIEPINERIMDVNSLKEILKVDTPIFESKFISENESNGGKKRKRKTKRKNHKKSKKTRRH